MNNLYLTPASISYLSQFILSLLMTAVLADSLFNRKHFKTQGWYHFGFLCCITIFSALLFFETTLLPGHYLIPVYLENPVLAIGLVFLYLFIYRFPKKFIQRRLEAGLVTILSMAYAGFEIIIAIHRFNLLLMGTVEYRFDKADTLLAIVVFFIPIAFLRQSILADERPISWYRKIWNPEGIGARSSRAFAAVFIIPILLALPKSCAQTFTSQP